MYLPSFPHNTLPQLALYPASGANSTSSATESAAGAFGSMIENLARDTADTLRRGEAAAVAGIEGSMPLQTVVERVMAAERTLQAALSIREKAVGSYLEISRMQI